MYYSCLTKELKTNIMKVFQRNITDKTHQADEWWQNLSDDEKQRLHNRTLISEDDGWDCPNSPTKHCVYGDELHKYDEDSCIYCGQPEERK